MDSALLASGAGQVERSFPRGNIIEDAYQLTRARSWCHGKANEVRIGTSFLITKQAGRHVVK